MESLSSDLCGWELNNPDPERFETRILEVFGSCKDCRHLSECRSPSESIRCLIPKEGTLRELGQEKTRDGDRITYFALVHEDVVKFIRLRDTSHYWADVSYIEKDQLPDWALSRLMI